MNTFEIKTLSVINRNKKHFRNYIRLNENNG